MYSLECIHCIGNNFVTIDFLFENLLNISRLLTKTFDNKKKLPF